MSVDKLDGGGIFKDGGSGNKKIGRAGSTEKQKLFRQNYLDQLNNLKDSSASQEIQKTDLFMNIDKKMYHGVLLINALNLHKSTVQSLKQLSQQQNDFLKAKNYNQLFETRYEKESLLENLKKWGNEIRNHYSNTVELQKQLTSSEKERLLTITENISSLVEEVLSLEIENRVLLEKRKSELSDELGAINFYHESLFSVFENKN